MAAVLLALTASIGWGASEFLGGIASRRARLPVVLAGSQLAGLVAFAPVLLLGVGAAPSDHGLLLGFAAGVIAVAELALIYIALRRGPVVVMAPIAALGAVLPVVAGIAGGDRIDVVVAVGIVCALAGAVAASWIPGERRPPRREALIGAAIAFGAALGAGAILSLLDAASKANAWWAIGAMRVGGAVAALVLLAAVAIAGSGVTARLSARAAVIIAVVGLSDVGADVGFANAAHAGALSVVAVLASLYPVTTIALGALALNERPARVQLGGAMLAFLGVAVLAAATG